MKPNLIKLIAQLRVDVHAAEMYLQGDRKKEATKAIHNAIKDIDELECFEAELRQKLEYNRHLSNRNARGKFNLLLEILGESR